LKKETDMNMKIEDHAANVVKRFKEMLSEEQVAVIGDEHFEELEVLIEAAIGSSEAKALLDAVVQVETLARSLAKHAAAVQNLNE
jgi:predicted Co/Zn/Cd cation transporter (cation efflux family)